MAKKKKSRQARTAAIEAELYGAAPEPAEKQPAAKKPAKKKTN